MEPEVGENSDKETGDGDAAWPKLKCVKCGYMCKQLLQYKRHMQAHKVDNPHTCSECSDIFATEGGLNRHLRLVHQADLPDTLHHCQECRNSFSSELELNNHISQAHTASTDDHTQLPLQAGASSSVISVSDDVTHAYVITKNEDYDKPDVIEID